MVYFFGFLMGFFVGTNGSVEKRVSNFVGFGYSNSAAGLLSKLGGLGGWFCIIPAAYFIGADYGNGFLEVVYFLLAVFGGSFVSGFFQISGISYIFSSLTVFINASLVVAVYLLR